LEGIDTVPGVYPGVSPSFTSGTEKRRKYLTMGQYICDDIITTHNNSLANLIRGVGERVLYTDKLLTRPTKPVNGIFTARCGVYMQTIVRRLGRQSPVTRQEFVEYYKGRRRTLYQKAVDGLVLKPVRVHDSYLSTFIKAEKTNISIKSDPAPRVIQPRNPRYNVEVGKYLLPLEHKVYEAIDDLFGSPTIMSKYNSKQQAEIIVDKWNSFTKPVCIGLDASRFDQHVSVQALEFEHSFYDKLFNSHELRKLLKWQLHNVGFARTSTGKFKYIKKGSRMSGDMNTSLGNKFLMCLMAMGYIKTKTFRIEFVNNGDDCLIIFESKNLNGVTDLQPYFKDFGFKIVCEAPVFEIEHIEFCQCKPLLCNGIWRMVRNVKTCLLKDVTAVNLGHDLDMFKSWLYDVAGCGKTFSSDVPVLGEFYRMLAGFGTEGNYHDKDARFSCYRTLSKGLHIPHDTPDDYGRFSFWKQTGLTPDAQLELEGYFNTSIWGGDKRQFIENHSHLIKNGS
jgi:hypothetical protein